MTDDLQARLDRAMETARDAVLTARSDEFTPTLEQAAAIDQGRAGSRDFDRWIEERNARVLDRYAALVALRARYEAAATWLFGTVQRGRMRELDAECEKLLGTEEDA